MSDILSLIASERRRFYETRQRELPPEKIIADVERKRVNDQKEDGDHVFQDAFRFEKALRGVPFAVIAEIKKASPSKGVISEDFPYLSKAREYEKGGATAISCLTEPKHFLGSDDVFREVRSAVSIPMLRKDFVVCPYQIYESVLLGADAVLLISSILADEEMGEYLSLCHSLGMNALCECRSEGEIKRALSLGAKIIGVNNRDLRDFSVDSKKAERYRSLIPDDCVYIAESGFENAEDIVRAHDAGVGGVLIGEALMRSDDAAEFLRDVAVRVS